MDFTGTNGNDAHDGDGTNEVLDGLAGNDTLGGLAGNDTITAGAGYDYLRGGDGDDSLSGGADDDFLSGGTGNDTLDGGAGIDRAAFGDATVGVTVDLNHQGEAQDTGFGVKTLIGIEQVSGSDHDDVLTGDGNANWLWALGGNDTVSAGGGDDLVSVGHGDVHADGGAGTDTLAFYSNTLTTPVNVSLALQGSAQNTGQGSMTLSGFENLAGTSIGNDTLTGDGGANVIAGWGGSDSLVGGAGDDTLLGDGTIFPDGGPDGAAGAGVITVFEDEGSGADTLDGGAGNDLMKGGAGNDLLIGGAGLDTIDGGAGSDTVSYAAAAQWVNVDLTTGTAAYNGGAVEDTIIGVENVIGSANWDILRGDAGSNSLSGGDGHDSMRGELGDDTLNGDAGDDYLVGGAGNDMLNGGAGIDRAGFSSGATAGVTVDLNIQGTAQNTGQGMDTLVNIEHVSGTRYSDVITGDGGDNWLWGGSDGSGVTGNDTISAGAGNDLVQVGAGNHSLDGGTGVDTLSFQGNITDISSAGVIASLAAQGSAQATGQGSMTFSNFENLSGSNYGDTLSGDSSANLLAGYGGSDSLVGAAGDDVLLGDGLLHVDTHGIGLSGAITTFTDEGSGNDTLMGGLGNDSVVGGAGDDWLQGDAGDDTVLGGDGQDQIFIGTGTDSVDGGAGTDRLSFSGGPALTVDLAITTAQATGQGTKTIVNVEDVFGTTNSDTLSGDAQNNWLWGNNGGDDKLDGRDGDDVLMVGAGAHTLDGGQGVDALVMGYSTPGAVSIDLTLQGAAQTTGQGSMLITGIENLSGTIYADTLVGDASNNLLAGMRGSDSLVGGDGNDLLKGDGEITVINGVIQTLDDPSSAAPTGVLGDDTLRGDGGADTLQGGGGNDLLIGGSGADSIDGGAGFDTAVYAGVRSAYTVTVNVDGSVTVSGPDGTDTITGVEQLRFDDATLAVAPQSLTGTAGPDSYTGGVGGDTYSGFAGADTVYGGDGDDSLAGGDDADYLRGQAGADTLQGGSGDDFLNGGSGNDIIDGGAGADRAVFGDAPGGVTVDLTLQGQAQNTGFGVDTLIGIENVSATESNDVLTGDGNANWLWTLGGNDTVSAGGGDDLVSIGHGDVHADGGSGTDTLEFYSNTLTTPVNVSLALQGGAQTTGQGSMTFSGFENLVGTSIGNDTLAGDGNANLIAGWGGSDLITGGAGNDTLLGDGTVFIDGGPDGTAGSGPITIYDTDPAVTAGADTLDGGDGADTIKAGGGDDLLTGGAGNDVIDGGVGTDVAVFSGARANYQIAIGGNGTVTVTDLRGGAPDGVDVLTGVELLRFSDGTVSLAGTAGENLTGTASADTYAGTAGDDTYAGQAGGDTVAGAAGADSLLGGDGYDFLRGQDGADTLRGGNDEDYLNGGAGNDIIDGGAGLDRAAFGDAPGGVTVNLTLQGTAQNTGFGLDTLIDIEQVSGTEANDRLTGDGNANWLWTLGGNDTVSAGAGDDLVSIGRGAVIADGGTGVDTLEFYSSSLTGPVNVSLALQGSAQATGQGSVNASGFENLVGTVVGGDTLAGDSGANLIAGWGGADSISGGAGNDTLLGDGTVFIDGGSDGTAGAGPITVYESDPSITVGADTLDGGAGDDTIKAGGGNDLVIGGAGADVLDGGAGSDTVSYVGTTTSVVVDLAAGTATGGAGADTLTGFEAVIGGSSDDVLSGDAGNNTLTGGAGDDVLRGRAGDDLLDGGANGPVLIAGGVGGDVASYSDATGDVTVSLAVSGPQTVGGGMGVDTLVNIEDLFGGTHNDVLTGNSGSNFLYGSSGDDSLTGAGGDDALEGGLGDDTLDGGAGLDTAVFSQATSGVTVDLNLVGAQAVGGGLGTDTLLSIEGVTGSSYADTLTGTSGTNWFDAGAGDDQVSSGTGNDTVFAGAGADTVTATAGSGDVQQISLGTGADKLVLDAGMAGTLTVTDFVTGASGDRVDLNAWLAAHTTGWNGTDNPFEAGFLRFVQDGGSALLQINADGAGDDFTTVITFQNSSPLLFGAANLGFPPLPRVVGGTGGDVFQLDAATLSARAPTDPVFEVDGGAGVDEVHVVAPTLDLVAHPNLSSAIRPSADGTTLELDLDGDGVTDLKLNNVEDLVLNGQRVVISGDLSGTGLAPNTIHYQGTTGADLLDASGLTSNESIRAAGGDGNDTLIGAGDDDTLEGDDGDDSLDGGLGPDILDGGAGNDTLVGGSDTNTDTAVFSGNHDDYVITDQGGGVLTISGPDGDDKLIGIERLQFGDGAWGQNHAPSGQDTGFTISSSATKVFAASDFGFADTDGDSLGGVKITTLPASGTLANNGVAVTAGQLVSAADIAAGHLIFTPAGTGSTTFTFQVKDDGLAGWGTNLDASANTITVSAVVISPPPPPPPPPPTVITSGTTGTEGADTATFGGGNDSFAAGGGADSVSGGAGADWLQGNAGADTLSGGADGDTLYGGRDDDKLSGDDGDDWLSGDLGSDTLLGGTGADTAFGGDGNDSVDGGDGQSYLRGGAGDDVIAGGADFDDAHGNEGNDTVSGGAGDDWVVGGKDNDQLFGDAGGDIVYGNLGNDTCSGGDGADLVRGGQGDDVVTGGTGNDWLSGDRGNDTITGGAGADIFHAFQDSGIDRVLDFNFAEGDRVQLDAGTTYTVSQVGSDTVIDMGGGNEMILVGVTASSLPDGWIFGA